MSSKLEVGRYPQADLFQNRSLLDTSFFVDNPSGHLYRAIYYQTRILLEQQQSYQAHLQTIPPGIPYVTCRQSVNGHYLLLSHNRTLTDETLQISGIGFLGTPVFQINMTANEDNATIITKHNTVDILYNARREEQKNWFKTGGFGYELPEAYNSLRREMNTDELKYLHRLLGSSFDTGFELSQLTSRARAAVAEQTNI